MTSPGLRPDPLHAHCRLVDAVAAAGAAPPDEWVQLRKRLADYLALGAAAPMRARLVDAVVDGAADADVAGLRAAAHAETLDQPKVTSAVHTAVLAAMRTSYGEVAHRNYAKVVQAFDAAAAKFLAHTGHIDVEAPAIAMVDQPDKARKAWMDAERDAHRLTALVPALRAAATLIGLPETAGRDNGGPDAVLLPLVCDPGDKHRRKVWQAWEAEGRCGRWSALAAIGCTIRGWPADQVDAFAPYRPARPLEERFQPVARGIAERYTVDPEDPGYQDEPEPQPKPRHITRLAR